MEITDWLGRTGLVLGCTTIRTSSPELGYLTPYDFALVDFAGEKKELMAAWGERLQVGDQVRVVLRKMSQPNHNSLIEYGLKLEKV